MHHTPLRALIFDVDGTLADTERDGHRVAFNAAFAELGLPWRWDETRYGKLLAVTGGRERLQHFLASENPEVAAHEREQLAIDLHQRKTIRYAQLVREGAVAWRPGVLRLLAEARASGLLLGIATTTSRANVDELLASSPDQGITAWFATIAAAEDAPKKKPDPSVYLQALQALNLRADECLAIEDSSAGLQAARAAGIGAIITVNAYTRDQDFSTAVSVVSDLGEPGAALQAVAGLPAQHGFVDVAQMHAWHRDAQRNSRNRHRDVT